MDYLKIDRLTKGALKADNQAAYLAEVWGDLNKDEGTRLLDQIRDAERSHSNYLAYIGRH